MQLHAAPVTPPRLPEAPPGHFAGHSSDGCSRLNEVGACRHVLPEQRYLVQKWIVVWKSSRSMRARPLYRGSTYPFSLLVPCRSKTTTIR